jgi:hypothetical protein
MTTSNINKAPRKPTARSRITNGKVILEGIDGRSRAGRRAYDIMASLAEELGGNLTAEEQLQVRCVAAMTLEVERLTARLVNGEAVDSVKLSRASNALQRSLNSLRRHAKSRTKIADPRAALSAALAEKANAKAAA